MRPFMAMYTPSGSVCAAVTAEAEQHEPESPTLYAIVGCVTLNRIKPDTELVVGLSLTDARGARPTRTYVGLGDDPRAYRFKYARKLLTVSDAPQ